MKAKLFKNKISVRPSKIHNYGVFADKNIRKGEIIEECYIVPDEILDGSLNDYTFDVRKGDNKAPRAVLGYGMIYNHSRQPNADFDAYNDLMVYKATRFICKGEEIFISYGKEWFAQRNFPEKVYRHRYGLINPLTLSLSRMILMSGTLYGGFLLMTHYHNAWIELMTSLTVSSIALP
jgi:uncharacterized protein